MNANSNPWVYKIGFNFMKGSIRLAPLSNYDKPERPKTIEGFKGYDKVTLDDGSVFRVTIAKP